MKKIELDMNMMWSYNNEKLNWNEYQFHALLNGNWKIREYPKL